MGKFVIALITLVVGMLIGGFGALTFGGGAMMGVGLGTGLTTGVCMTVQAAEDLGLMTPAQVDQVLTRAAENLAGHVDASDEFKTTDTSAECKEFLAKFKT